eukprot:COSAG06_NODE_90_length_24779_cov_33.515843_29_plen_74_part_00
MFVFDFFWHRRNGWGGYSWDRTDFPDGAFPPVGFLRRFSRPFSSFETAVGFLRRFSFAPSLAKLSSHSFHFLI